MMLINCDWVATWWQWSVHLYTNKKKESNYTHKETDTQNNTKTQSTQNIRQDTKQENKHKTNNNRQT
jgi:hypothetical protein